MRRAPWRMLGLALALAIVALGVHRTLAAEMMGYADELKTAITHAGFAEKYDTMKEVGLHLHHVVNCIVGEGDPMFDKAAGNPCQGQGKGLMADLKAKGGMDQEVQVAWWLAHMGSDAIKMANLAQAKAAAHIINVQLTAMSKM